MLENIQKIPPPKKENHSELEHVFYLSCNMSPFMAKNDLRKKMKKEE